VALIFRMTFWAEIMKWGRVLNSSTVLTAMLMPAGSQWNGSTGMAILTTGVAAMGRLARLNLAMAFCLLPTAAPAKATV